MPTPNAHDVTADRCPKLHCIGAIDPEAVLILKFDHTGAAEGYAGAVSNIYQVEDLVLWSVPLRERGDGRVRPVQRVGGASPRPLAEVRRLPDGRVPKASQRSSQAAGVRLDDVWA